jgi:NAD(P)H-dependent FMN reductase
VLKNALDYLRDEYRRKPFGIITVSAGEFGGILCLSALRQVVLHLGGVPIPAILPVARIRESIDSEGMSADPTLERRVKVFFEELLWYTEALSTQRRKTGPLAGRTGPEIT